MKKVFAFVAFAAAMMVAGQAFAQLSVNAGYSSKSMKSHYKYTSGSTSYAQDTTIQIGGGFFVGGSYNYALSNELGISGGLYFNYNSRSETKSNTLLGVTTDTKNTVTMMELNIPILANYKLALGNDLSVFAFVGPNIQIGVSAKEVTDVTVSGSPIASLNGTTTHTNDMYAKEDGESDLENLKSFDLGVMVGIGAQYQNFRLEAGYNMGLLNRCAYTPESNEEASQTFGNLFVGVGYCF